MIVIKGTSFDPYFNLAAEEYMLKNTDDDVFMLWQNERSVIIGKNQNAWAEVNCTFVKENNIKVARRMTGGGAVFHDLGNVNFTFITDATDENKLNFKLFSDPIIAALEKMGIKAQIDGRNDLVADGFKISGNAECVAKNHLGRDRILHHGTLLFSADMSSLAGALNVSKIKLKSKGIKSVRSRVCNIASLEAYRGPSDTEGFIEALFSEIAPEGKRSLTEREISQINTLRGEKYATDEWIWGKSPAFDVKNEGRFSFGTLCAEVKCEGGKITAVKLTGDFFGTADISLVEEALADVPFEKESVKNKLEEISEVLAKCISGATPEELSSLIVPENAE